MKPHTYPKLTITDKQGVQRFYWATVHEFPPRYITHSQKTTHGNIVSSQPTYPRAQTIRTDIEQAHFEVQAIYRKRERLDWQVIGTVSNAHPRRHYKPMLAQTYPHCQPPTEAYAQPKLDGVRCCATIDGLWTRKNMPIVSVPHIADAVRSFFSKYTDILALDGELYVHGWPLHKISGLVRRTSMNTASSQLEYHIFDIETTNEYETYELRRHKLDRIRRLKIPCLKLVETHLVEDKADRDFLHQRWVRLGYEGSMYRHPEMPYKHNRSYALIKRKDFQTDEFRVVNITEGNGAWTGVAKRIHYRLPNGTTFETGVRGTIPELTLVLKHKRKYIDKPATVRYLYLDERSGIPQIPVTINLARDDI